MAKCLQLVQFYVRYMSIQYNILFIFEYVWSLNFSIIKKIFFKSLVGFWENLDMGGVRENRKEKEKID